MAQVSVLIVDAQVLFSDALAMALSQEAGLAILEDRPSSGIEALQSAMEHKPDVALVDYWLPEIDGPALARELGARLPATKTIHLSWFHGPHQVEESLASGAAGFLPKSLRVAQVVEAVYRAAAGESPIFEQELRQLVRTIEQRGERVQGAAERLSMLTARELKVLGLLAAGLTVHEVSNHLGITEATARTHVHRILAKTKARSQLEAVAMARDLGWTL